MIRQDIDIEGYWKIIVIYNAFLGTENTGFTYTDFHSKRSVIGISSTSTQEQLLNTIVHEAKHAQSHICKYYRIEEDSEEAAYLIGYIVQNMHRVFRDMISTGVE